MAFLRIGEGYRKVIYSQCSSSQSFSASGRQQAAQALHLPHRCSTLSGASRSVECAHADGHVVEVPGKVAALGDDEIKELVARDVLVVLARVADGHAERDMVFVHEIHRRERLFKVPLAAAAVVGLLKALDADRDKEVADAQHLLAEGLIDERAVREGMESNVAVLFAQADDVGLALCCVPVVTLPFRVRAKRTFSIRRKGRDPFPRLPVRRSSGAFPCARRAVR